MSCSGLSVYEQAGAVISQPARDSTAATRGAAAAATQASISIPATPEKNPLTGLPEGGASQQEAYEAIRWLVKKKVDNLQKDIDVRQSSLLIQKVDDAKRLARWEKMVQDKEMTKEELEAQKTQQSANLATMQQQHAELMELHARVSLSFRDALAAYGDGHYASSKVQSGRCVGMMVEQDIKLAKALCGGAYASAAAAASSSK